MNNSQHAAKWTLLAATFVLLAWFAPPHRMQAQAANGNNTVCNNTTCTAASGLTYSVAYIDAAAFAGTTSTDFCSILNTALHQIPTGSVGVIDARGLYYSSATVGNTSKTCASGVTPWSDAYTITAPSTILLPSATGSPADPAITISTTWVLPNQTRIIGLGRTNTVIAASATPVVFPTGDPLIAMGSYTGSLACPSPGCTGIGVSDLELDGLGANTQALNIIGIQNWNSQDGSYVSHVTFHEIEGTALDIETVTGSSYGANNSGPYTDLTPSAGGENCGTACPETQTGTACIRIVNTQTKGIHGFTCTANGTPYAGLYLDASGNTIEDGHFEGVVDGIAVGAHDSAQGNVILNISGAGSAGSGSTSGPIVNTVHICNPSNTYSGVSCTNNSGSVSDITLSQVQSYTEGQYAVLDDLTATEMQSNSPADLPGVGVALYAIGESPFTGGYTALNTFSQLVTIGSNTTQIPMWGYANSYSPAGTSCPIGSIFSNAGGSGGTIFVCVGPASHGLGTWKKLL
jgi:hypothetical protein